MTDLRVNVARAPVSSPETDHAPISDAAARSEWPRAVEDVDGFARLLAAPTGLTCRRRMTESVQRSMGNRATRELIQRAAATGVAPSEKAVERALADRSPGQPLDPSVRHEMEGHFGDEFADVRLHTDNRAAELAAGLLAHAFTRGSDIYLARGSTIAGSSGRRLLAHELAHVVQQRSASGTGSAPVISQPGDALEVAAEAASGAITSMSSPRGASTVAVPSLQCETNTVPGAHVKEAIQQREPALIYELSHKEVSRASVEDRLTMIDILLDGGTVNPDRGASARLLAADPTPVGVGVAAAATAVTAVRQFTGGFSLPELWDSFGKDIVHVANANADRWRRSFAVAAGHMRTSREVQGQETYFLSDVEAVAGRYLGQNEQFCNNELQRLGLSQTGEVITGPPTANQAAALAGMRDDASKIAAAQEAMRELRKVTVGYEVVSLPDGGTGPKELGTPTKFDPDPQKQPNFAPPEEEPDRRTWEQVKKAYEGLDMLVQARLQSNPGLYPLVRGAKEDPTKTGMVARGTESQALSAIGAGLRETLENIAKTRPLLKTVASDLEPIHGQLLAGTVSVGGRNWKTTPFYEVLGRDLVDQLKPGPWWLTLGLTAARMGLYLIASLATGGTALAIGLAVEGAVDVALKEARADALESAAKTNVTAETGLVSEGQVDEAKADMIMAAASALMYAVTEGGAGAVRSALRSVQDLEKQAAGAAARAVVAADEAMNAASRSAEEASVLVKEAKDAAAEATVAAEKARSSAGMASIEETNRTAELSRRATSEAAVAQQKAADATLLTSEEVGETVGRPAPHNDNALPPQEPVAKVSGRPANDVVPYKEPMAKTGTDDVRPSVDVSSTPKLRIVPGDGVGGGTGEQPVAMAGRRGGGSYVELGAPGPASNDNAFLGGVGGGDRRLVVGRTSQLHVADDTVGPGVAHVSHTGQHWDGRIQVVGHEIPNGNYAVVYFQRVTVIEKGLDQRAVVEGASKLQSGGLLHIKAGTGTDAELQEQAIRSYIAAAPNIEPSTVTVQRAGDYLDFYARAK